MKETVFLRIFKKKIKNKLKFFLNLVFIKKIKKKKKKERK